jgi:hypothetical protein
LPASDEKSLVSKTNMADTCGQEGCHGGSKESFALNAGQLIHQKIEAAEANPLRRFLKSIGSWFS